MPVSATVIGLMSGTSHDAIDAAAAQIHLEDGAAGPTLVLRPLGLISAPYEPGLRRAITAALPPSPTSMGAVCELDTRIGQAFADLAARADTELCDGRADLAVSHGQTLFHWVEDGRVRGTLQLGQAAWIAERTGLTTVSDLRSRDVAAGGQGAPLVSLIDVLWLHGLQAGEADGIAPAGSAAAVNLGGIANATVLRPGADPVAFDTGPANALLDAAVHDRTGGRQSADVDGLLALAGTIHEGLLKALLADGFYERPAPKTTGKELFHPGYVAERARTADPPIDLDELSLEDLAATLTELTGRTLAGALTSAHTTGAPGLVVLSGGGTRNPAIVAAIRRHLPASDVRISDELGFDSAAKEALAFAALGFFTVHGLPGALPSCTGAGRAAVLGSITPGTRGAPPLSGSPSGAANPSARVPAPIALRIEQP